MSVNMPSLKLPSRARFWKKKSAELSDSDPSYRAIYLGNVLTGWAKGDGCVDKPLATLWKNHVGTDKPNIIMKVTVCPSGLKAVTKEHGLTEYWANRITYCSADPAYPKVFCWIYRHEGRKLKQELRCHAVLCPSANKARVMAERLKARLHQALVDFKKEKLWRQNARLSLANSVYENPTMPHRKILLQTGSMNYRPPIERGKAASKLKIIEEVSSEEEEAANHHSSPIGHQQERVSLQSSSPVECQQESISLQSSSSVARQQEKLSLQPRYTHSTNKYTLLCNDETDQRRDSSFSLDKVSVSTVSTVIDSLNGESSSISVEPNAGRAWRPPVGDLVDLVSLDDSDEDDAEEDLVTNHLENLSIIGSNEPIRGQTVESGVVPKLAELSTTNLDQDTISDESGYSEESNGALSCLSVSGRGSSGKGTTTVYVNHKLPGPQTATDKTDFLQEEEEEEEEEGTDLTVHGVLISEFSNSEQLKYLERSRQFTGQIQPDFCINI